MRVTEIAQRLNESGIAIDCLPKAADRIPEPPLLCQRDSAIIEPARVRIRWTGHLMNSEMPKHK